jgi:general stress protein YciG
MANQNPANNLSEEDRSKGGSNSGGNFKHDPQRASNAGKKGAKAEPTEAKRKGGENSHRGNQAE